MSKPPKSQREQEHAECVKTITTSTNLLGGSGIEAHVVLGALGSVVSVMLVALIKFDPAYKALADQWLVAVKEEIEEATGY